MHHKDVWINQYQIVERCLIDLRSSLHLRSSLDLYFAVYSEIRYSDGTFTVFASFLSITLILKGNNCLTNLSCVDVLLRLIDFSNSVIIKLTKKAGSMILLFSMDCFKAALCFDY